LRRLEKRGNYLARFTDMADYRVRYLVLSNKEGYGEPKDKQTVVERINAESVEKARVKAEELAEMRSKKFEKWICKAIEQI